VATFIREVDHPAVGGQFWWVKGPRITRVREFTGDVFVAIHDGGDAYSVIKGTGLQAQYLACCPTLKHADAHASRQEG